MQDASIVWSAIIKYRQMTKAREFKEYQSTKVLWFLKNILICRLNDHRWLYRSSEFNPIIIWDGDNIARSINI